MKLLQAFIVLIDISGYTKFIRMHKVSLIHAERIISELLESIIDASSEPLVLNKLQGDAALFYAPSDGRRETARGILGQIERFFSAFAERERALVSECGLCSCDACLKVGQLKLKAIAHHGEVALKKIRHFEEIAGEDVILAHRLLKNSIRSSEYLLLSKALHDLSGGIDGREPERRAEHAEGIGRVEVVVYYPRRLEESPADAGPRGETLLARMRMMLKMESYLLRRLVAGPPKEFANLKRSQEA